MLEYLRGLDKATRAEVWKRIEARKAKHPTPGGSLAPHVAAVLREMGLK